MVEAWAWEVRPLQTRLRGLHQSSMSLPEEWTPLHSARCTAGCAKKIYKEGGVAALFKGNFATMIKVAPQTAIQFAVSFLAVSPFGTACKVLPGPALSSALHAKAVQ